MWQYLTVSSLLVLSYYVYKHSDSLGLKLVTAMLSKAKNSDFKINAGTSSATLSYERYGKRYSLYVPYHKGSIVTASKVKVFLVKDDQRIEITQQPGIPYLVTAAHLGGSKIIVVNGDVQTEYEADQYPRL